MTAPLYKYRVRVYDPEQKQTIVYEFNALSDGNAKVTAKDGYTGLFGNVEERQRKLVVVILDKSEAVR